MLLAIDVGNTNTVFALFGDGVLIDSWRLQTEAGRSKDEYASFVHQFSGLAGYDLSAVNDVIISSVVPETDLSLNGFCDKYLGCEPICVSKDIVPIQLDVKRSEDVGADRLVNALAVTVEYTTPAIVIDFGTATTFDVIDADGAYAGGVIAPGINLSLNALHNAASKLPKVSIEKVDRAIGKTTVQAMQAGLYLGYKGLIEGILRDVTVELGQKPKVLATGGLAHLFADNIDVIDSVDEHLTLKGLYEIYKNLKDK